MRPVLLLSACLGCLVSGCGTVANLTAPPPPGRSDEMGKSECSPFGGVTLSAGWGAGLLVHSLDPEQLAATGVGLLLLMDTPLSLAGDVVTLPIVYARRQGASWATWWGDQAGSVKPEPKAGAPVGETSPGAPEPTKKDGQTSSSAPPPEAP